MAVKYRFSPLARKLCLKKVVICINRNHYNTDIAVVGGGASGLAAAVAAARQHDGGGSVMLFDALPRCGKKLLATGNGRCNLTNRYAEPSRYHTDDGKALSRVFSAVSVDDALSFFESMGLVFREEDEGRIYPSCGQASAVLDLLRLELARLHIPEVCGFRVEKIRRTGDGFVLSGPHGETGEIRAKSVIIACGGKASPSLGGTDSGYELLRSAGHSLTGLTPSLCPIPVQSRYLGSLKGIRAYARASVCGGSAVIYSDEGEVQFGDKALSGIVMFQLSSAVSAHHNKSDGLTVALDMLPETDRKELIGVLARRRELLSHLTLENFLTGMFNKRVGMCILKEAGMTPLSAPVSELSDRDIIRISSVIKEWSFPVNGTAPWNSAQVTAGGIRLSEFDGNTMQSRLCKGLYAAGEVLNVDGFCGGYNLQWAWSSGILAGRSCAMALD